MLCCNLHIFRHNSKIMRSKYYLYYVAANPKYRIQLSLNEARELKFLDYYYNENKPELIKLGSGLHRYFTDTQAAQELKNI